MNPSIEPQAYGAGRAGSAFDPIEFIKKPQVILRLIAWVFAIIVFACIAQEGYYGGVCVYNGSNACGYGVAIGVIAFLFTMVFLALDVYFPNISNIKTRKSVVIGELVLSGILVFLWFIGFCYMADQWRQTNKNITGWNGVNSVQAAIAFAFFSILVWGGLVFFTFRRYREGVSNLFSSGYEDHSTGAGAQPYAGHPPAGGTGGFSSPPFTATQPAQPAQPNYQPPTY